MFDFKERVVIVTGASGNMGRAVARAFREAGARVVPVDRAAGPAAGIHPDPGSHDSPSLAYVADVNDPASVQRMVEEVIRVMGRIDVLVHTVGGYWAGSPVHQTVLEVWDGMIALNARTAFIVSRAVIPEMLRQGSGKIIHIGARPGLAGAANAAAYSASKGAVIRLTESLSAELGPSGINVNCVVPGTLDTPQNREAMPDADTRRWVAPESLADVILFLASSAARDVHGASIPVFGRS